MANPEHLAILEHGVEAWNKWNVGNIKPDLSESNLTRASLRDIDFHGSDLRKADFSNAILIGAEFIEVDMSDANLREADLSLASFAETNLSRADLSDTHLDYAFLWADLSDAVLVGANLNGANISARLDGADLTNAQMLNTVLANVDLSRCKGLDSIQHDGPSTIGIDTIYRSNGEIPEAFLRGAGVPDTFITFARSLVGKAIEFYSCFISYSSKDRGCAERLYADLQAQKLRVWFAQEDLKIGDRFQERIEESIRRYDKVMIVLSEASVESRWVEREVNAAREREERENRLVLFPIRIDDAVMSAPQPWAADIRRSRHIGDFRGWKDHDSYQKAFQRLLRDLAPTPTAKP
jgi:hypothetical protein